MFTVILVLLLAITGCSSPTMVMTEEEPFVTPIANEKEEKEPEDELENELKDEPDKEEVLHNDSFEGYTLIEVDGGNQSGHREPNVVVDIGFGDRKYYAFTNEYGQLVKVTAISIII